MKKTFALLALALPLLAAAQTVWRCGPEGRSYSSTPCADGRALETLDARPASDVETAHQRAAREQRLADRLHRERMAQEAAARGSGLAGIGPASQLRQATRAPSKHRLKKRRPAVEDGGTSPSADPAFRQTKG